jgi:hypothetical protein
MNELKRRRFKNKWTREEEKLQSTESFGIEVDELSLSLEH